jgi:hypothetical protein
VCRSCTADLPAASYPDVVEDYKDELVRCWLNRIAALNP